MKRLFCFLFIPLCLIVFSVSAQQPQIKPVQLAQVAGDVYELLDGQGSRGGAYIGDNGVLVIDSKMTKESVEQTIAAIKGKTDLPIKYLVNTHADGDHTAGNKFFPESVTFIAHENCRSEFLLPQRNGNPSDWLKPELVPFLPSVTFSDKMDVYLGSKKIELWYFGKGHTTGDMVVYLPLEKVAFLGDQVFVSRPQLIHSYKGGNSFEHVKTLSKMLETIDAETFCSGHSDPVGRQEIMNHIEKVKAMQAKIKSLVSAGKKLEDINPEFQPNEARLVSSIYNELMTP